MNPDKEGLRPDTMKTRIQKWGKSLAVRIPRHLAALAGLVENAEVEIVVHPDVVTVTRVADEIRLHDLVARITRANRHDTTEWRRPQGREVW